MSTDKEILEQSAVRPELKWMKAKEDMNVPEWHLHALSGRLAGRYAVSVSGNWRLTFSFDGKDVVVVDYEDYH